VDYPRMDLGTVTRTFKGEAVSVVRRSAKCGRRGERSVTIPSDRDMRLAQEPNVYWLHREQVGVLGIPTVTDLCGLPLNRGTVDELLNLAERRRYNAFVSALRAYVEAF